MTKLFGDTIMCRKETGSEVRTIEEEKKEIAHLQKEVGKVKRFNLAIVIVVTIAVVSLQVQYSKILSYYQNTVEMNLQLLSEMKAQNLVLQQFLSAIEENQKH